MEYEPVNNDLLMNYSGMGLSSWLDPSTGQFRSLPFPQLFGGNGFDFNFAAAMPFALSGPQASFFRPCFPSRRFSLPFPFRPKLSHRPYTFQIAFLSLFHWPCPALKNSFSELALVHEITHTKILHDPMVPSLQSRSRPHCKLSSCCCFLTIASIIVLRSVQQHCRNLCTFPC